MRSLVRRVLVLLFSKLATGLGECPMMHRTIGTVCGTDGVTYPSLCELEVARTFDPVLDIAYFGRCTTYCKDIWDPVCGNDLVTYSSLCLFEIEARKLSSLEVLHVGKCWSGEDKEKLVTTSMKTSHSGSNVRSTVTQPTNRMEVGAEVGADKPRRKIYRSQRSKKILPKSKTKRPRYKSYVHYIQSQREQQEFF